MAKILLDIDGVILPSREKDPWGHFSIKDWDENIRMINQEMRSRLVRLFHLGEVVWCSSWNERSLNLGKALFLPKISFIPIRVEKNRWIKEEDLLANNWSWKLKAISDLDDGHSPLVWIDDNIERDAFLWQDERAGATLLIKTDEFIGLKDSHMETIEDFLKNI